MKVILAGYNLDCKSINKTDSESQTPETISAAYARISRSPKAVNELREEAAQDVNKARSSNQNIVFEMGHASVAEHAVFNFDIIGISRLLVETVQRTRLASFTEKSQRYVTLEGDYLIPEEIRGTSLEHEYKDLIDVQISLYKSLYDEARKHLKKTGFEGAPRELRGKAKEDARYVLPLATETQFGMTINARSLERLLQRLDRINLKEADELKDLLESKAKEIAPSLVKYTKCEDFENLINEVLPEINTEGPSKTVELLKITEQADDIALAGLIFENRGGDFNAILNQVKKLPDDVLKGIYSSMFTNLKPWQVMPRAFELIEAEFAVAISSSCFGQLKRHRMATMLRAPYDPDTGFVIPPLIQEIGGEEKVAEVMQKTAFLYHKLQNVKPGLGDYILTNAHKLRVYFKANLREFYHFTRLRSDGHAQWEIRELSLKIEKILKEHIPYAAIMLKGKDAFKQ